MSRAYATVNLVILSLLLFVPVFVAVSPVMQEAFPDLWRCHHKTLTGEECPFCGFTGNTAELLSTGRLPPGSSRLFRTLLLLYLVELPLRGMFLILRPERKWKGFPATDAALHLFLLLFSGPPVTMSF